MLKSPYLKEEITLLNEVINLFNAYPLKSYQNHQGVRQASVNMILRFNPSSFQPQQRLEPPKTSIHSTDSGFLSFITQNKHILLTDQTKAGIEILFVQRSTSPLDVHSGQVAFPGGKCDGEEDDYAAAVREAMEECGINLSDPEKYVYLGKFPRNFYAYTTPKGKLFVSIHMFFQLELNEVKYTVNPKEIEKVFWIPLRSFLFPNLEGFQKTAPVNIDVPSRMPRGKLISPIVEQVTKGLVAGTYRQITLPNDSILWGLTFFFMVYFVNAMVFVMKKKADKFEILKSEGVEQIAKDGLKHEFIYKEKGWSVAKKIVDVTYYKNRMEQFEGDPRQIRTPYEIFALFFVLLPLYFINKPRL